MFSQYKSPAELPKFKKYNLIYGPNASGKTTLSRLFFDLNLGEAPGFPDLKYKISTDDGTFTHGKPYSRGIRVFNSEYVENNIGEIEGQLNPIFIIGEDNKTLASQLESDEKAQQILIEKKEAEEKSNIKLVKEKAKKFTEIAKTISQDTAGTLSRTYTKRNAEAAFNSLDQAHILKPKELDAAMTALKESALEPIESLLPLKISITNGATPYDIISAVNLLNTMTYKVVEESATSIAIEALTENPELASWVEKGRELHEGGNICQYCLQDLPKSREAALEQHFNESDKQLKSKIMDIQTNVKAVCNILEDFSIPDRNCFYKESHEDYIALKEALESEIKKILKQLHVLDSILVEKLTKRTESYKAFFEEITSSILETINSIGELIERTNSETTAYETRLEQQTKLIETHHLSSISDDLKSFDHQITKSCDVIGEYEHGTASEPTILGLNALDSRIVNARATLSNSHKGANDLSDKLASFLGRDDLKFVAEGEGYRIERFGRPAQKLSEGEKTAITFLHFVVALNDQDFNLQEGIVVIDDPISSLDSASVYQAFGFLKVAVKDAKQIFLLTHNFDFLKLLLNWLKNGHKNEATYLMLKCTQSATSRETSMAELDRVLRKANDEYQYLFKLLRDFESDGTVANSYHIPNVVRKILEVFLGQHSSGASLYKKLMNLDYDEQKKTALNKYANDLSHPTFSGIDPSLIGETQTNVGIVLKMIEDIAPLHYKSLVENTT